LISQLAKLKKLDPWASIKRKNAALTEAEVGSFLVLMHDFDDFLDHYENHPYLQRKTKTKPEDVNDFLLQAREAGHAHINGMLNAKSRDAYKAHEKAFKGLIDKLYKPDISPNQVAARLRVQDILDGMVNTLKSTTLSAKEETKFNEASSLLDKGLSSRHTFDPNDLMSDKEFANLLELYNAFKSHQTGDRQIAKKDLISRIEHNRFNFNQEHVALNLHYFDLAEHLNVVADIRDKQLEKIVDYWKIAKNMVFMTAGLLLASVALAFSVAAPFLVIPIVVLAAVGVARGAFNFFKTSYTSLQALMPKRNARSKSKIRAIYGENNEKLFKEGVDPELFWQNAASLEKTIASAPSPKDKAMYSAQLDSLKERFFNDALDETKQDSFYEQGKRLHRIYQMVVTPPEAKQFNLLSTTAALSIGRLALIGTMVAVSGAAFVISTLLFVGAIGGVAFPPAIALTLSVSGISLGLGVFTLTVVTLALKTYQAYTVRTTIADEAYVRMKTLEKSPIKPIKDMRRSEPNRMMLLFGLYPEETLTAEDVASLKDTDTKEDDEEEKDEEKEREEDEEDDEEEEAEEEKEAPEAEEVEEESEAEEEEEGEESGEEEEVEDSDEPEEVEEEGEAPEAEEESDEEGEEEEPEEEGEEEESEEEESEEEESEEEEDEPEEEESEDEEQEDEEEPEEEP